MSDLPISQIETTDDAFDTTAFVESPLATDKTAPTPEPQLEPPSDLTLTPRQTKSLDYLARRHMRHPRIIKRPKPGGVAPSGNSPGRPTPNITDKPSLITAGVPLTPEDNPLALLNSELTDDSPPAIADVPPIPPLADLRPAPQNELTIDTTAETAATDPPLPAIRNKPQINLLLTQSQHPTIADTLPPMPPLPLRHPQSAQFTPSLAATRPLVSAAKTYPNYHTLTHRQKFLGHLTRKHLRQARASDQRTRRRFWATTWTTIASLLIILLSLGAATSITIYDFYTQTQAKYEHQVLNLRSLLPPDNLKVFDSKGLLIGQLSDQGIHTTVKLNQISLLLQKATVATEDKNFWTNQGIDLLRILRAALDDLRNGRVIEGGSTITQQLIKNLIVGNQATLVRKLEEIVLAPQINSIYKKPDILEMYLNSIYYGEQAYGVDAAASVYFGLQDKPGRPAAMQLDLAQSAMLAGLPSNPSQYDPLLHPQAGMIRFEIVLNLMETQRYITKVQELDAIREAQNPHFFKPMVALQNRAPHFFNFVLQQLQKMFGLKDSSQLSRSGLAVYTTLDIALQDKIQKIAQSRIAALRDAHHLTNAAEVLIDFHTGAIISLLGSIDYNDYSIDGQFDVATQSYRQPGSSFKPYVYVTAFAQGASPAQAIDDKPTTINLPGGDPPTFTPSNYDLHFHGHMTLRCALQNSLNVPAVKVLQHVGIDAAMQTAHNMGITSYQGTPGYSLVLGGLGVRLLDHTSAMGVFANGGIRVGYYAINKIVFVSTGELIFQHQLTRGQRVISPQLAYMMTNVLSDNTDRIPEFADCNVLQLYSNSQQDCWYGNRGSIRPAAAKTGTTNDFRDNWTIGYTTDYVMGVWAGNDDNTPMIDVTGVQGAAPIWHDSMLVAEQGHPMRDFANPGGLEQAKVTYPDGVQTTDWFLPGTVPTFAPPTPTPTPVPTLTPLPTGTPSPLPTPTPTPQPPAPPAHPYCPSSYTFAFSPPSDSVPPPDPGWW